MFDIPLPTPGALALYVMCVFAFSHGCAGEGDSVPGAHPEGQVVFRVVEEVFDDGWKTAGLIIVTGDGGYQWTIHNLSKANSAPDTIEEGHLSRSLMSALQEDASEKKRFEIVEGVPTYQYGIDDHHVAHPNGIRQLLSFVKRSDSSIE